MNIDYIDFINNIVAIILYKYNNNVFLINYIKKYRDYSENYNHCDKLLDILYNFNKNNKFKLTKFFYNNIDDFEGLLFIFNVFNFVKYNDKSVRNYTFKYIRNFVKYLNNTEYKYKNEFRII